MNKLVKKILILNGPNLNLLGIREPEVYGYTSLSDIEHSLKEIAKNHQLELEFTQSNLEGELINKIQSSLLETKYDFIIINPAAFTHTSIALRDTILAVNVPFIEVHISNIYKREKFRHHSYFSDIAVGVICGLGIHGYTMALNYAIDFLEKRV